MFKFSELSSLYVQRLEDVGIEKTVIKTRLKKALLEHYNGKHYSCFWEGNKQPPEGCFET